MHKRSPNSSHAAVPVYNEKTLAAKGYVEIRPGVFQRSGEITPAHRDKKVPDQFANLKGGKCKIGETIYNFRSGWEATYAQYLEFLKVNGQIRSWEYECKCFWFEGIKSGCTSYLPDFKVVENDGSHWWAEVKGYLDQKGATKLKRMAKYFPEETVKLIRKDEIASIKKSGIIGRQL